MVSESGIDLFSKRNLQKKVTEFFFIYEMTILSKQSVVLEAYEGCVRVYI